MNGNGTKTFHFQSSSPTANAEHMEENLLPCNAAVRLQARTLF